MPARSYNQELTNTPTLATTQVISEHATALLRNLTAYNAEIKMRAFEAGCLKPAVALLRSVC